MGPVPAMRSGKQIWEEGIHNDLRVPFSFPPQSKLVVAKVNKPCYYGFARYIKAIDTGVFSGVWCFVNFLNLWGIIHLTFSTVNCLCEHS